LNTYSAVLPDSDSMLRETDEGCLLDIEVVPNSDRFRVEKIDPWIKRLKIRVTESPIKDKANRELLREMRGLLGAEVRLVHGHKTSRKTLLIAMDRKVLRKRLGI
jgi:uncharacterized protein (TIGR00251 family)